MWDFLTRDLWLSIKIKFSKCTSFWLYVTYFKLIMAWFITDFLVQTFDTLRIYKTIRLGKTYETTKFWDFENSKQKNQCYSTSALVYLMLLNMHDVSLVQLKLIWFLWWRCAEIQKSEIQTSQSPIMHLYKESAAVLILVVYAYHINQ